MNVDVPVWEENGILHIDVRGQEPPHPLIAILQLIESREGLQKLIVILDREPVYLFPELHDRGWRWARLDAPKGEVRLLVQAGHEADTDEEGTGL